MISSFKNTVHIHSMTQLSLFIHYWHFTIFYAISLASPRPTARKQKQCACARFTNTLHCGVVPLNSFLFQAIQNPALQKNVRSTRLFYNFTSHLFHEEFIKITAVKPACLNRFKFRDSEANTRTFFYRGFAQINVQVICG